ncbi:urease accessory protein UreD [Microbacterium sp.]|uniref:urease accessory protein UreD n=1 Tax=Microbacterium sp. TaxID=51671 RepID=UPI0037C6E228
MIPTRIAVRQGDPRARVDLAVGALAPRLVARDDSRAHVALAAAGMILLGGDHVHVEVVVGAGCLLELEDVGGTIAYRADGRPSAWTMSMRVEEGATLLWRGLPFVVTDGADVERRTTLDLATGATAVIRETLVLGRHGESGGRLRSAFTARDAEGPLLAEQLDLDGLAPEPGVLGEHRVLDAVIALGFRPSTTADDLVLEHPGAIARHLGAETHTSRLDRVWDGWAERARQRTARHVDEPANEAAVGGN